MLLLDKPLGLSSNTALQIVKRLYRAEKAGHTGTLDPLATGLLPICFGAATKFSQVSLDADKRYTATLQLGTTTTTADAEGEVIDTRPVQRPDGAPITRADVEAACAAFVGQIDQLPPMHSALKRDGKPLYAYARAGIDVPDREPRQVTIHRINVLNVSEGSFSPPVGAPSGAIAPSPASPIAPEGAPTNNTVRRHVPNQNHFTLDIHCSKGTYIRTLAEDIGRALGCGAHLAALRRTASGPLDVAQAFTLDQLHAMDEPALLAALNPPDHLLADWPVVRLDAANAARFLSGLPRRLPAQADLPNARVYGPEPTAFLGSAHVVAGELIGRRILSLQEASAAKLTLAH